MHLVDRRVEHEPLGDGRRALAVGDDDDLDLADRVAVRGGTARLHARRPYFGRIRSAPSSRITSPFSIRFSMIGADECGVLGRVAEAGREGNVRRERLARRLRQAREHRRVEQSRRDRHAANPVSGEIARDRQGERCNATLRGGVGSLPDLTVEGRDRGGVDDHAALPVRAGRTLREGGGDEADHVERSHAG